MSKKIVIKVQSVGQAFGCMAIVEDISARRIHETRVYPYGQRGNARAAAEQWAAERGLVEVSS